MRRAFEIATGDYATQEAIARASEAGQDALARRADRLFARPLKQPGITTMKTLADFDWTFNAKIQKTKIMELGSNHPRDGLRHDLDLPRRRRARTGGHRDRVSALNGGTPLAAIAC